MISGAFHSRAMSHAWPARVRVPDVIRVDTASRPGRVTVSAIKRVTAAHYGCAVADLEGPSRLRSLAYPRQVAMYLAADMTKLSLPRIGMAFGGRDHTTVLHGQRAVIERMAADVAVAEAVGAIRAEVLRVTRFAL